MECRITCEDPFADFMPAGGRVGYMRVPAGPGVRWDGWIEPGSEVPLHYDSLLGKLVVWGESRERAIKRMRRALDDLVIVGVPTSREFHQRVMVEPGFCAGDIDIEYWERTGKGLMARPPEPEVVEAAAIAAALLEEERHGGRRPPDGRSGEPDAGDPASSWLREARREGLR
jgi:acetyl-CoA carboxylase biotin carboxylase subunit